MRSRILLLVACVVAVTCFADAKNICNCSQGHCIGVVSSIIGQAFIYRNDVRLNAQNGSCICESDVLETKADSRLQIVFQDNSLLTLSPKSKTKIDQYAFENNERHVLIKLIHGMLGAIVARILELEQADFLVQTTSATVGVRGTEFIVGYGLEGITEVTTLSGKVILTSREDCSSVEVAAGQARAYVPATTQKEAFFSDVKILTLTEILKMRTLFQLEGPKIDLKGLK
jgi:hypothetical protein